MTDATSAPTAPLKVLVYSDDVNTRQQVILALGRRPHPDLPEVEYVEVATEPVVIPNMDAGGIDLAILDGEAVPAGGMGIAKQLKDEIYRCPPVLVLTGRPQDAWLATWSRAEAAVPHPLDPLQLAEAVVSLLRSRVPGGRLTPPLSPRDVDDDPHLARRAVDAGRRGRPDRRADIVGDGRDPRRGGHARPGRRVRSGAARQG